jgi:hypothetical protein
MDNEIYKQNVGWEEKINADAEAKRLAEFISTHSTCRTKCAMIPHNHAEPQSFTCTICGSVGPYHIRPEDVPPVLR